MCKCTNHKMKSDTPNVPRHNTIVELTPEYRIYLNFYEPQSSILCETNMFLYLGEVPNMKDHCSVIGISTNNFYIGYHVTNFREKRF